MTIQLNDWKVKELTFSIIENSSRDENGFTLETANIFFDNNKDEFAVIIKVNISDVLFDLKIESFFTFKLDEEITEDFKLSDFPKINAPAIAFPYLRAYISNLTLQSGVEPVILPSINFVKLAERKKKDEE
jgi:preprotein translocase subunit SecB